MQNLTATKFGNFWATVMLQNQGVDQILNARKRIDDVPITLTRETGYTKQIYQRMAYMVTMDILKSQPNGGNRATFPAEKAFPSGTRNAIHILSPAGQAFCRDTGIRGNVARR